MSKTKVLFVCLGNICRSPAAEAVFQKLVDDSNRSNEFELDSAGTSGFHAGEKADKRVRAEASKREINVTSLSRQFVKADFKKFDHIIVMDDSNYENVLKLDSQIEFASKVSKMTDYASDKFSGFTEVPDPYYGGEEGFILVLDLLENCCNGFMNYLNSK